MSKQLSELSETFDTADQLFDRLAALSLTNGGAWTYAVRPFTKIAHLYQYPTPSSIPDDLIDLSRNTIFWKGERRNFSKKAIIRDQNRCTSNR